MASIYVLLFAVVSVRGRIGILFYRKEVATAAMLLKEGKFFWDL